MVITKGHSILAHSRSSIPKAFGKFSLTPLISPLGKGGLRGVSEYLPACRQVGKIKPLKYYILSALYEWSGLGI
jgi:hypothetical protein